MSTMPGSFVHDPPLPQHLHIVALETHFWSGSFPQLTVPDPYSFTLTSYDITLASQLSKRVADADVIICTGSPLKADVLLPSVSPRLRLVIAVSSGIDNIDTEACKARGIRVLNCPNCNSEAISEHVTALSLALRRSLLPTMRELVGDRWINQGQVPGIKMHGQAPRNMRDEVVAIIGYGGAGRATAKALRGLGMQVIVAARRGQPAVARTGTTATSVTAKATETKEVAETMTSPPPSPPLSNTADQYPDIVPFEEALKCASIIVVSCPRVPETLGLIGPDEVALMQPDAILINIARGGIVQEEPVLEALRQGRLGGAGFDVFAVEPANTTNSPLVRAAAGQRLNLIVTSHTAWVARSTDENYAQALQDNLTGFLLGQTRPERTKA